jgi:Uma2 family endonuclease
MATTTTLDLDMSKRYTYADYLTWQDDQRRELVDGYIHLLRTPGSLHQQISVRLSCALLSIIEKHKWNYKVYHAPFDVRLPQNGETDDKDIYNVVEPDICVICDPSKLDERGCLGAPDMVIEIQSPWSARFDLERKRELYERSGVREYWIVPLDGGAIVFLLQPNGKYSEDIPYASYDKAPIGILNNYELDFSIILANI